MVIASGLAFVALAALAFRQSHAADAGADPPEPVFGTYDTVTHVFTPATPTASPVIEPGVTTAATVVRKGTLVVEVTANVATIPIDQQVLASVSANLFDRTYQNSLATAGFLTRSGNTAKITFSMPYIFTALSASETITVEVELSAQNAPYPSTVVTTKISLPADATKTVVPFPLAL